jgi:hypothetical protein
MVVAVVVEVIVVWFLSTFLCRIQRNIEYPEEKKREGG